MPSVTLLGLKDQTERMIINDLAFQDPMLMFCELDISVILYERRTNEWVAFVDVDGPGVDKSFFEVVYILDEDGAQVASYRPMEHNPYTTEGHDNAA